MSAIKHLSNSKIQLRTNQERIVARTYKPVMASNQILNGKKLTEELLRSSVAQSLEILEETALIKICKIRLRKLKGAAIESLMIQWHLYIQQKVSNILYM